MSDGLLILGVIFVLLLGNGFFSGSEIALISSRKSALQRRAEDGSRGAEAARRLKEDPETFLATVQVGVTVCGTLAGVCGGWLASKYIEPRLEFLGLPSWLGPAVVASIIVSAVIVYVEMVLGELVPKAVAIRHAEAVASFVGLPVLFLSRLSRLPLRFMTWSTRAFLRLFGFKGPVREGVVSAEEIEHMVAEGELQGILSETDASLLQGVFNFRDLPVRRSMIPRTKIFAIDVKTPPEDSMKRLIEGGFSRVPVYDGSIDTPLGLLYVKDVLSTLSKGERIDLRGKLHAIHVVPETKKVGELLRELQRRRSHMALVIDEHGSVTGLATLEDLVEEIVGEIRDEYDDGEEKQVERLRSGDLVVEGTVGNSLLRETHDIPIPEEVESETIGGFMLERLGAVPRGGEVVEFPGYRLTVVDVERNRVAKVKIEKLKN